MKNSLLIKTLLLVGVMGRVAASEALDIKAFSLSQLGTHRYDAAPEGQPKTEAQLAVDYMYSVGARHVNLIPEARMADFKATVIQPLTPLGPQRADERNRLVRLIGYIKSKGMTVGIRPIILVERKTGFEAKWHGNIQPTDPAAWFDSLRSYLDIYANIARVAHVDEFTVGAELYSMTVGLEDQWPQQPFGFPREWTLIVKDIKAKLPGTRVMYDINYTDETSNSDGTGPSGGEIERWRYRLVDLKPNPANPRTMDPKSQAAWQQLKDLWLSLDMVGIDMYRSLLPRGEAPPADYAALVAKLEQRAGQFASDIDSKLYDIEAAVGAPKRIVIKEIGFKSCTGCYTDPFLYDDARRTVNITHQAASYEAFMNAFVKPGWAWLAGIAWWDVAVDPARGGASDPGFTVRGKSQTEEVLKKGWN